VGMMIDTDIDRRESTEAAHNPIFGQRYLPFIF